MQSNIQTALIAIVTGFVGYKIGVTSWERKKTDKAVNKIVMLSNLYIEISEWFSEEGYKLDNETLYYELQERLSFVAIAAKATDS